MTIAADINRRMRSKRGAQTPESIIINKPPSSNIVIPLATGNLISIIITTFLLLTTYVCLSTQQTLCPKACTCDEQNLEIVCKEYIGASGMPHTLNPSTKRMIINNAQTSQFTGLDYLSKLETLDLAYNKLSAIDFSQISKNINLISLNTSHNSIVELKDSLVTSTIAELGLTTSNLFDSIESIDLRALKSAKINVINLVLNHNFLVTVRDFTFIRWHRLQRLDLSYNSITVLEPQSLYGLNKLEVLNLSGNRLTQVPTLALQSTIYSLSSSTNNFGPSSVKILNLSDNSFQTIGAESFSQLEKAQELYLESCSIQSIHEQAFKGLYTLYLLSLDKNNLREVPQRAFSNLGLLRLLKLNANNISHLPVESFSKLENLEELQINNGSFDRLEKGVFRGIDSLRTLEIGFNPNLIKIEKGTFDSVPKLTYLSLYSNSLTSIPDSFHERSHPLQFLDLRNNPLFCGCDLKWLTKWLKRFNGTSQTVTQQQQPTTQSSIAQTATYHVYGIQQHQTNSDDTQSLLMDSLLTNELLNLTCVGPPALNGKLVVELPENKLECLEPASDLHVHIGFACLFFITFIMTFVCLLNFCKDKKHLFVMLKENLVQNQISMMLPYSENLHKNVDDLKKETQFYGPEYEHIDYNNSQQLHHLSTSPIYTLHNDRPLIYDPRREQCSRQI